MGPSAKVIADSITENGERLTTFEVVMNRFVLAEFNTHRVISKNSASSRAIPAATQIKRVSENPALPLVWPAEQKGMQGGEELDEGGRVNAENVWLRAKTGAVADAQALIRTGVHKSLVNRILEPFMWHTVVCTATAWQNFFGLRANSMAQPEIRVVAELMQEAYRDNYPTLLGEGQWHLPYTSGDEQHVLHAETLCKISAARCARVSYLTQAGQRDIQEDIRLFERLTEATPMHASPLEHVATPRQDNQHVVELDKGLVLTLPRYGNFLRWHQLRFDVEADRQYQAFA